MMLVPRSWQRNAISWRPLIAWKQKSAEAEHLLGHNIIRHDLPHLVAVRPKLANIFRSPIDTLWLNPLAFPRNPYHHLVKHYQDGRLQAGHVNDPEYGCATGVSGAAQSTDGFDAAERRPARCRGCLSFPHHDNGNAGRVRAVFERFWKPHVGSLGREVRDFPAAGGAAARGGSSRTLEIRFEPAARMADSPTRCPGSCRGRGLGDAALGAHAVPRGSTLVRRLRDTGCESPPAPGAREE